MHYIREIKPPRSLTPNERNILDHLLSPSFQGRNQLYEQVEQAYVSGECTCGCPSIILSVNKSLAAKATVRRRIPIEAEGVDSDGMPIHVLLHVVDGYLSEIEIYREDSARIQALPDAAALDLINLNGNAQGPRGGDP